MTRHNRNPVDYLDLAIEITSPSNEVFEHCLERFLDCHVNIVATPRLRKNLLRINSLDLVSFLGYLEQEKLSEFELYRFKSCAEKQLTQLCRKTLAPEHEYHYQWCLAALKNLKEGRHLA